jgi:hypothetical protein
MAMTTLVHSKRKSFVAVATKTKDYLFLGRKFRPQNKTLMMIQYAVLPRYFCLQPKWP